MYHLEDVVSQNQRSKIFSVFSHFSRIGFSGEMRTLDRTFSRSRFQETEVKSVYAYVCALRYSDK